MNFHQSQHFLEIVTFSSYQEMNLFCGGKFSDRVVMKAVKRMLPGGPLSRQQLTNLKVYSGGDHPHEAQNPEKVDFKSMNNKNVKRY